VFGVAPLTPIIAKAEPQSNASFPGRPTFFTRFGPCKSLFLLTLGRSDITYSPPSVVIITLWQVGIKHNLKNKVGEVIKTK
jgi:hypothetical protein